MPKPTMSVMVEPTPSSQYKEGGRSFGWRREINVFMRSRCLSFWLHQSLSCAIGEERAPARIDK
jgi:hypothetical protein